MAITKLIADSITSGAIASTPSFFAQTSANANLTRGTATLAPFNTEIFDTNSAYNNTSGNYKFTVPSGEAGRYFVFSTTQHLSSSANDLEYVEKWIYLNGSAQEPRVGHDLASSSKYYSTGITINKIMDLSVGDYIQIYIGDYTGSSTPILKEGSNFGAYKIIE